MKRNLIYMFVLIFALSVLGRPFLPADIEKSMRDLEVAEDPETFSKAAYALSHFKNAQTMAVLSDNYHKFPRSGSCANAINGMDSVIFDILSTPGSEYLTQAVSATKCLWRKGQRNTYLPLLKNLLNSGPDHVKKPAMKRLMEETSLMFFEDEKKELASILKSIDGSNGFEEEKEMILARLEAYVIEHIKDKNEYFKSGGNTRSQEYGDALFRFLNSPLFNYNHAGIFAGLDSTGTPMVRMAVGWGTPASEMTLAEGFTDFGSRYYGAYNLFDKELDFEDRRNISRTARDFVDAQVLFTSGTIPVCIEYYGDSFDGTIGDISGIRCDGVVEYCYENYGFRVWRNKAFPDSVWSIIKYPDSHNNKPGAERRPDTEFSPWAQRGAPCDTGPLSEDGCDYPAPDTRMTMPARINLPTYQVTQQNRNGKAEINILAHDESGIHRIAYQKPGDTEWNFSPVQPQDPLSAFYSFSLIIETGGILSIYATDNGGNKPDEPLRYKIDLNFGPYEGILPSTFTLSQNYPNPFNSSTSISFSLPERAKIRLEIFDINGKMIKSLKSGFLNAGLYTDSWSAENLSGGIYFCRLDTGSFSKTVKLVLIK